MRSAAAVDSVDKMDEVDVAIVGYGPVGQLLAVLLAQRGWKVAVIERWPRPYPMPRAVAFDGESARILAQAGVGSFIKDFAEPSGDYVWLNGDGAELLSYTAPADRTWSGWPDSTSMYQPGLEAALIERGRSLPGLRVFRGYLAASLAEHDDVVEVAADGPDGARLVIRAAWLVGCDGANSFVRDALGVTFDDLQFRHDWLICDVVQRPPRRHHPNNLQICDPARPRTAVSAGPGHRRWEFMRVPGETREDLDSLATAWRLLGQFDLTPENAMLERHAVYTFEAGHARRWRVGRAFLAGDAAHLMPPFAAQGMSSGFRDAANLAWKLDLALAGRAGDHLMDTYGIERARHVQHAISMSVSLGRIICQTDPAAARDRDEMLLAMRDRRGPSQDQPSAIEPLADGLLHRTRRGLAPGELTPQARIARDGATKLSDELIGPGFVVLTSKPPNDLVDAGRGAYLRSLGARVVQVLPSGTPSPADGRARGSAAAPGDAFTVVDVDDVYRSYLAGHDATAAIVRPDCYLFGTARDGAEFGELVDDLRDQLSGQLSPAWAAATQS